MFVQYYLVSICQNYELHHIYSTFFTFCDVRRELLLVAHFVLVERYNLRTMKLFAIVSLTSFLTCCALNSPRAQRRTFLSSVVANVLTISSVPQITSAATISSQMKQDRENIASGYKRLSYLLDNWEKETTVCGRSDNPYIGLCERTPEKVMEYLGYKSMNDPLFRADKTLSRLQTLVDDDNYVEFMEAMERYNEKAEEASNTAYLSSWGEANPGGGKDRIEFFIERSKKQVETARDSLGVVMKLLNIES